MTASLLLTNGYIHSVSEPYANALHADNGVVAWLGSDEAGQQMVAATASGPVATHDLRGMLVTPAFIDGFSTTALGPDDPRVAVSTTEPWEHGVYYAPVGTSDHKSDGLYIAANQLDRLHEIAAQHKPPTQWLVETRGPDDLDHVLAVLKQQPNTALMRCRHRIVLNFRLTPQQIAQLVDLHASVTIVPQVIDGTPIVEAPVASLIAAGVHVATGTGEWTGSIWELLTALVEHHDQDQRVSTRAAFNTVSRDGVRVWPSRIAQQHMAGGQIAVGSPADLNIWQADQLGVQAPDVKAAHWSTDKRAGTALLPMLSSAEKGPRLEQIIRNGQML